MHYSGHGKGKGDWWLPDHCRFKLEHILTIWSERQHHSRDQELLLIMDSCYSGANVRRLDCCHQRGQYENVEVIAASHGVAKFNDFGDIGSDLTKAICRDKFCPVGTVCTHSLISKSKSSKLVTVKRDRSKRYMKFKWKL